MELYLDSENFIEFAKATGIIAFEMAPDWQCRPDRTCNCANQALYFGMIEAELSLVERNS